MFSCGLNKNLLLVFNKKNSATALVFFCDDTTFISSFDSFSVVVEAACNTRKVFSHEQMSRMWVIFLSNL